MKYLTVSLSAARLSKVEELKTKLVNPGTRADALLEFEEYAKTFGRLYSVK